MVDKYSDVFEDLIEFCRYFVGHANKDVKYPYPASEPVLPIDISIVEGSDPASVKKTGDRYLILISRDAWLRLLGFCSGAIHAEERLRKSEDRDTLLDEGLPEASLYEPILAETSSLDQLQATAEMLMERVDLSRQMDWPFVLRESGTVDQIPAAACFGILWLVLHEAAHIDRDHFEIMHSAKRGAMSETYPWMVTPEFMRTIEAEADSLASQTLGACLAVAYEIYHDNRLAFLCGVGAYSALLLLKPEAQFLDDPGDRNRVYDTAWQRLDSVEEGVRKGTGVSESADSRHSMLLNWIDGAVMTAWFAEALGEGLRRKPTSKPTHAETFVFIEPLVIALGGRNFGFSRFAALKDFMIERGWELEARRASCLGELNKAFPRVNSGAPPHGRFGGLRLTALLMQHKKPPTADA